MNSTSFFAKKTKMRYKITTEYDGTNLVGWQKQREGESVQSLISSALKNVCGEDAEIFGAGRTDAGVHALGQVAHFDISKKFEPFRIREAINFYLREVDAPVSIVEVQIVDNDFNARFSAKSRSYIYRILNRRSPSVLNKNRVWWVPVELDVEKMREGAKYLLGHHDFTSFRAAECQALSPMKTLDKIEIEKIGDEIRFYVEAKSFLYHQVRNMVGTLKMVGDGHFPPEKVKEILDAKNRAAAGPTAPACGLYFSKVEY